MNRTKLKSWMKRRKLAPKHVAVLMGRSRRHIEKLLHGDYKDPNWTEVENMIMRYENDR